MQANVADDGLVRMAPHREMSFATKLVGTFGYIPPEFATTWHVSTNVNIYSFNFILLAGA